MSDPPRIADLYVGKTADYTDYMITNYIYVMFFLFFAFFLVTAFGLVLLSKSEHCVCFAFIQGRRPWQTYLVT